MKRDSGVEHSIDRIFLTERHAESAYVEGDWDALAVEAMRLEGLAQKLRKQAEKLNADVKRRTK